MLPDPLMYEMPDVPNTNQVDHVNKEMPEFSMPEHRGAHRVKMMPATLDIQRRARLAINAMTATTDPDAAYETYWFSHFMCNPPRLRHSSGDDLLLKFIEILPLMRHITGSQHNAHVDRHMVTGMLKNTAGDGLYYWPVEGRPWHSSGLYGDVVKRVNSSHYSSMLVNGMMLASLTNYYLFTGDEEWKKRAIRNVEGYRKLLVEEGDRVTPKMCFWGLGGEGYRDEQQRDAGEFLIWYVHSLFRLFAVSGYEPALELGRKLSAYLKESNFTEEGEFVSFDLANHFHTHTRALMCFIEQAILDDRDDLWEFVNKSYLFARSKGEPATGYFPEFINHGPRSTCELCEVGEMIDLAVWLSRRGVADYWDDADRYIRNQFAAGQLIDADFIRRYTAPLAPDTFERGASTDEDAAARSVGSFAGWATGSQWGGNIMQCCTANCARALYYLYDSIVTRKKGAVQINLLLNHITPEVVILSHIPYEGRIDVEVAQTKRISLRLSEGGKAGEARACIDGKDVTPKIDGRYLDFGEVDAGSTITVRFPIEVVNRDLWIEKHEYHYTFKGTTVIEAFPREELGDLYNRVHYRNPRALWQETDLYLPEKFINWAPKVDG